VLEQHPLDGVETATRRSSTNSRLQIGAALDHGLPSALGLGEESLRLVEQLAAPDGDGALLVALALSEGELGVSGASARRVGVAPGDRKKEGDEGDGANDEGQVEVDHRALSEVMRFSGTAAQRRSTSRPSATGYG
jgi:hypothetical protein